MKHIRKLSLALAVLMGAGMLTGCESSKIGDYASTEVAKYGKESIMLDEANFWLRYQQMANESYYGWFYTAYYGVDNIWTMDTTGTGVTMGDNLHTGIMSQLWQTRVLAEHAADYDIALTDAQKEKIKETVAQIREDFPNLSDYADVTDAKIEGWLEQNAIASLVAQAVKDNAEIIITDEEVQAYSVEYITVTKPAEEETAEAGTEEAAETAAEGETAEAAGTTAAEAAETTAEAAETTAAEAAETTAEAAETTAAEAAETTAEAAETTAAEAEETTAEAAETTAETTEAAAEEAESAEETAESEEAEDVVDLEETEEEEPALEGEELANAVLALAESGTDFHEIEEQLGVSHYDTSYLVTGETSEDVKYTTSMEMAAGEVRMITEENDWIIVKKVNDLDEEETESRREEILTERQNLAFSDTYAGWAEAGQKFTVNEKIWSQILVDSMIYEAPTEEAEETEEAGTDAEETAEAAETAEETAENAETAGVEETTAEAAAAAETAEETEAAAETAEAAAETTEAAAETAEAAAETTEAAAETAETTAEETTAKAQ